jgi:hypothetical protein
MGFAHTVCVKQRINEPNNVRTPSRLRRRFSERCLSFAPTHGAQLVKRHVRRFTRAVNVVRPMRWMQNFATGPSPEQ